MKKMLLIAALVLVQLLVVSPVSADGGTGDRVVFGGTTVVDREDVVGDMVVFGGSARVLGKVTGDVVVFGGSVSIDGQVKGSVLVFGGSAELKSTSTVGKDVATFGGSLKREQGAVIGGSTVRGGGPGLALAGLPSFDFRLNTNPLWGIVSSLIRGMLTTIVLLGLAVLAVVLFPRQLEVTEDVAENAFWQSAGIGLLTLLAVLLLIPVLVVTLIGIPVAFLLVMALLLVILYALVSTAGLIGERVLGATLSSTTRPLENTLVGILLIMLIAVPFNAITGGCLGSLLVLVLVTPAVGAAVLSRFGTIRWRPSVPPGLPPGTMFPTPPPPASAPEPPPPAPPEEPGGPQA